MSLLIKGMEMPKNGSILRCTICVAPNRPGSIAINSGHGKPYSEFYELAEVPTPHGRLIDADILLDAIRYGAEVRDFCNKKCKSQDCQNCVIKAVYKIIREVPTIIEAEG